MPKPKAIKFDYNLEYSEIFPINSALSCLADSLGIGIVVFDHKLQILQTAGPIEQMFHLKPSLDQTLAQGTDKNVWNEWTELLMKALKTNQHAEFHEVHYKKFTSFKLFNLFFIPANIPENPPPKGGMMLVMDITHTSSQEHQYLQAERFMSIGKITGRVAHELNNPLDGILRYINLSLRVLDLDQPNKAKEYLQHCRTGLKRMTQILGELLEFSRSTHLALEQLPLDRLLEDALHALESRLEGIQISLDRQYSGPCLMVRSDSMFQVFCNLIKNAGDAMEGKGQLQILLIRLEDTWQVSFRDSGPGFDPDRKEDLFQPFFTTKPFGRGTGLGLAICKDIVEKFGGTITADNIPEGGSIFTIHLPLKQQEIKSKKESSYE